MIIPLQKDFRETIISLEEETDSLEGELNSLKKSMNRLLSNYKGSKFRHIRFRFYKKAQIPNKLLIDKEDSTVTYKELCEMLRFYISSNSLYLHEGTIKCDKFLRELSGKKETLTFFELVKCFHKIIM